MVKPDRRMPMDRPSLDLFPMGNLGRFPPRKASLRQSQHPQPVTNPKRSPEVMDFLLYKAGICYALSKADL